MEPFELIDLVEECKTAYQVQIEEKALQITSEGENVQITSDRELLKKILDNLLSNAIYFTPEGGSIKIRYEEHRLCIINEGVTIEDDLLPHVFEPFVTSVYKNKAHGLGLYVVSYYAKLLHCHVKLKNLDHSVMAELSWE
jgi:signal transduction histidine kinase